MDENIIIRFKEFLEDKGVSASELAEKIGVQRSSISHILSGRNKPSLDFIVKLLEQYPDLNIYWLLNNKGEKYREISNSPTTSISTLKKSEEIKPIQKDNLNLDSNSKKKVKFISVFYDDGTFDHYSPN